MLRLVEEMLWRRLGVKHLPPEPFDLEIFFRQLLFEMFDFRPEPIHCRAIIEETLMGVSAKRSLSVGLNPRFWC